MLIKFPNAHPNSRALLPETLTQSQQDLKHNQGSERRNVWGLYLWGSNIPNSLSFCFCSMKQRRFQQFCHEILPTFPTQAETNLNKLSEVNRICCLPSFTHFLIHSFTYICYIHSYTLPSIGPPAYLTFTKPCCFPGIVDTKMNKPKFLAWKNSYHIKTANINVFLYKIIIENQLCFC